MEVITQAQQNKRRNEFLEGYKKRAKKGNFAFRKVIELTGDGDYLEGKDSGEPKGGY